MKALSAKAALICSVASLGLSWLSPAAMGQTFTTLKHFADLELKHPRGGLTLSGEVLYGTLMYGPYPAAGAVGAVFKLNTDGTEFSILKDFTGDSSNGSSPHEGLTLSGTVLYGTAYDGGTSGYGTVFKLNTDGSGFAVLKQFERWDGGRPEAELTLSGNVLYGTMGGDSYYGGGTVYRLNTDGADFALLKEFSTTVNSTTNWDGSNPYGRLVVSDTVLYGTTYRGGNFGVGTIFKLNTNGTGYTVLKHFNSSSGTVNPNGKPKGGLLLSDGVLYGTTQIGGVSGGGTVFKINTDGTGYTVLRNFAGYRSNDGSAPCAPLALVGRTLYGTTPKGGAWDLGTVFKVNIDGSGYAVLKRFTGSDGDGDTPCAGITLSGSTLFGTTFYGGNSHHGTVFKIELSPTLTARVMDNAMVLAWSGSVFALQAASEAGGVYTNIPGATSPYTNVIIGPRQFFRLIGN